MTFDLRSSVIYTENWNGKAAKKTPYYVGTNLYVVVRLIACGNPFTLCKLLRIVQTFGWQKQS